MTVSISGMNCGHCVNSVREALAALKGVEIDDISIGTAKVRIDPKVVTREDLEDAIEDQGYEVVR